MTAQRQGTVVFVVHESPNFNYARALRYGATLRPVFHLGPVQLSPQHALGHARNVLKAMRPGDYMILSGDPVLIGICVCVAAEMQGKVSLLRWDKQARDYFPVDVDFLAREPEASI